MNGCLCKLFIRIRKWATKKRNDTLENIDSSARFYNQEHDPKTLTL